MSGYEPKAIERKWQQVWAEEKTWEVAEPRAARLRRREAEGLRAGDAALPVGRAPRRPSQVLRGRRRDRPLPPPPRLRGDSPDGLRRLRAAGREQRDQNRRGAARGDRALDRVLPPPVPRVGDLDRLVAGARHPHARVLPLDPVDLPAAVREGARLPDRGAGPVVPERRHRARQRAGRRRPLRALRDRGRAAQPRAVVLQDHRLRRPPARRLRPARVLARARDHDAAQLDRPLRGGRGRLPLRGARSSTSRSSRPAPTPSSAPPSSSSPPSTPSWSGWSPARRPRRRCASTSTGSAASRPRSAAPRTARRPACRSGAASSTRSTARRSRCSSPTTC